MSWSISIYNSTFQMLIFQKFKGNLYYCCKIPAQIVLCFIWLGPNYYQFSIPRLSTSTTTRPRRSSAGWWSRTSSCSSARRPRTTIRLSPPLPSWLELMITETRFVLRSNIFQPIWRLFQHSLFHEIRTLVSWLKSTLLLKNKCLDIHVYMKTQCLQTNRRQHYCEMKTLEKQGGR